MKLSNAQKRALKFMASGATLECLRPGSNRAAETEYTYSEQGVGLFFDSEDVEALFTAGLAVATPLDAPIAIDEELDATHQAAITSAGRSALEDAAPPPRPVGICGGFANAIAEK